jgi:ATP-dependent RNA helicase DDX10/DBP4
MDETPGFDATNLQVLILDEADRILDMGFADAVDAILENVPSTRQTMLFSATQTKSVKDLARLSLANPEYLAVSKELNTQGFSQFETINVVFDIIRTFDSGM